MKYIQFTIALLSLSFFLNAQTVPTGFSVANIGGTTWSEPVGAAFNKSGTKLFVWKKEGGYMFATGIPVLSNM
jgi:hypothetical protein